MYHCLSKNEFHNGEYSLVAIRPQDIFAIKEWRNAQIDILRQATPLTDEAQQRYFETVIYPSFLEPQPKQILFSFLWRGQCVGYGGLVHISWVDCRAEISFLLNPDYVKNKEIYATYFSNYLQLIKIVAFDTLQFNRLFLETYDIRPWHIAVIEQAGFLLEGCMRQHVIIDNKYVNSIIHGLLQTDYNAKK